jgi:TolB-like protein
VLRDEPAPLAVSTDLQKIIRGCLAKRPEDRFVNMAELRRTLEQAASPSAAVSRGGSAPAVGEKGFGIAVTPFKCSGACPSLPALAEGLTEEIVAGLSRFAYLRVLTTESAGAARYLIKGSLRQTGSQLRLAAQLVDAAGGARLWAETFIDHMIDDLRLAGLKIAGEESAAATGPKSTSEAAPAPPPSLAVLPFDNLSADKEQQYFSDGLAEEILNALAKVPGLRVIAGFLFRIS